MAECKHGLDEQWCALCLHGPERKQPLRPAVNDQGDHVVITAKFASTCRGCHGPIEVGEQLALLKNDDEQVWVHTGCTEEVAA